MTSLLPLTFTWLFWALTFLPGYSTLVLTPGVQALGLPPSTENQTGPALLLILQESR